MSDEKEDLDHSELIHIGYTNGYQLFYGSLEGEGQGAFYPTTEDDCYIPLYMLKTHAHRVKSTSNMDLEIHDDGTITHTREPTA